MKINMPMNILAADSDARTITGRIVTWNEPGFTNAGKTIFAQDSISLKPIKLLLEHQNTQPIGRVLEFNHVNDENGAPIGIDASFKIAKTYLGDAALEEAAMGLRDGFSVGIKLNEWKEEDGAFRVLSSNLVEVSLVESPAIDSARVSEVAASEEPQKEEEEMTDTPKTTEPEVSVESTKVEASAPVVNAPVYTAPRVNMNISAGQYALAQIQAQRGDSNARDIVAALDAATTTENIGVVPPTYLRDIIGIIDDSMPFAMSLEQGVLPATGMKFYRPLLGVQATAAQTAEAVEFDSTDTTITSKEVDVIKIAGANKVSVELLERSDPAYLDVLLRELAASWAQKADAYAFSIAVGAPGTSTGATLYASIADGIADSFGVLRRTPNRFLADTGNFAELLAAVDDNKRPLFAAAAPQNAAGLMTQGSTAGTIAGLGLVVDPNIDTGTGVKGVVYASDAATFYRGPAQQIRANVVSTGEIEIGVYGYVATCSKYPTAFRNLTVA
jgi:HK97 family phage prohead protease